MRPFARLSSTRDVFGHPAFKSSVLRWLWSLYVVRMTTAGRWFFWPTLVVGTYAGVFLTPRALVPLSYALVLWGIAVLAVLLFRPAVRLVARHADRVCAGELLSVEVEVTPTGWRRPGELRVLPHRLPHGIDAEPEDGVDVPDLPRVGPARVLVGLRCAKRGVHRLFGYRAETDFPFGIMRSYRVFAEAHRLLVYPRFQPLLRLEIPTGRRYQPGGVALASVSGEAVEYIGDREYREGDHLKDIDWRATARVGELIVREYREEYFLRAAVVLDTHVPKRSRQERAESFERAVSLCAAVADWLARQEYVVDIFAAGPDLYHLVAGRGLAYLDQILDILACVDSSPVQPFDVIEPELLENMGRISTVFCILLDWDEARRNFVHTLREQGVALKVIVCADRVLPNDPSHDPVAGSPIRVIGVREFEGKMEEL